MSNVQSIAAHPNKHSVQVGDFLYRVVDLAIGSDFYDETTVLGVGRIELHLCRYRVTKTTRCGAWVDGKRFINLGHPKRFAVPTKVEALQSFRRRKTRQIVILETQLTRAKVAKGMTSNTTEILGWDDAP